jgi:hypothetical protein
MSSEHPMPPIPDRPGTDVPDEVPAGVRAQLLATEHWSLLATRGTTWSEIMSRITIHLTVSSASLVVLALVVQASGFSTAFDIMSIGLAAAILVLGTLTAIRVHNASTDDAAMIIGMNRLRAAYVAMDPSIAPYLVTSWHDDMAGLSRTYTMGFPRTTVSQVVGSTALFLVVVNSIVAGTLGALVAHAAGAPVALVSVLGSAAGLGYLGVMLEIARRSVGYGPTDVHFPTPDGGSVQG